MEQHRIIGFIGAGLMIFCLAFPFIVINIRGPLLETPPIIILILLTTGFALALYGLCKEQIYRSQGAIVKDERTRKIWHKSRSYTLYTTVIFLAILMGLSHYEIINLDLKDIWWPVLIQIAITSLILRYYFNKKKDL